MGSFFRLPLALLAALPLLTGPAAWAMNCGCDAGCGTTTEAVADCGCGAAECTAADGCACCGPSPEATSQATPGQTTGDGCACGCVSERPAPIVPVTPGSEPLPAAAPSLPIAVAAEGSPSPLRTFEEPDPAATPPLRVSLCVWRI